MFVIDDTTVNIMQCNLKSKNRYDIQLDNVLCLVLVFLTKKENREKTIIRTRQYIFLLCIRYDCTYKNNKKTNQIASINHILNI
jgi:hypothetical protein